MEFKINTRRWDEFTVRERQIIDDALRLYHAELSPCVDADVSKNLRAELAATSLRPWIWPEDEMERARR